MPKSIVFLISLSWVVPCIQAQHPGPDQLGFESHTLETERYGTIDYYVTQAGQDTIKPLLVYLDGSGPMPLFQQTPRGLGSGVAIDWQTLKDEFRIVLISKPGIPFVDEVEMHPQTGPTYEAPAEYHERLSLDWRVHSADSVIQRLLSGHPNREVVVFGFSEGAQVAAHLASRNEAIDYLLLFGGNGLNQLFDFIIHARLKAERGQITHQQAQAEIDSLYRTFEAIYAHPKSTTQFWRGHTYKRWASFSSNPPIEALIQVDIPVYVAHGSRDQNPILSADYAKLEFLKRGKRNITYRAYPGYDHQFNEHIVDDGPLKQATPKIEEVLADAFVWLNQKRSGRE